MSTTELSSFERFDKQEKKKAQRNPKIIKPEKSKKKPLPSPPVGEYDKIYGSPCAAN